MKNNLIIKKKINPFTKKIFVEGDKSISIRWVLLSSLSKKKSRAHNLLKSEDVISALKCIQKLGSKVKITKKRMLELKEEHRLYNKKCKQTNNRKDMMSLDDYIDRQFGKVKYKPKNTGT